MITILQSYKSCKEKGERYMFNNVPHYTLKIMWLQQKHENKVAGTAQHYKHMKQFMSSEILKSATEHREFQCVYNAAYRIENTACNQQSKLG